MNALFDTWHMKSVNPEKKRKMDIDGYHKRVYPDTAVTNLAQTGNTKIWNEH